MAQFDFHVGDKVWVPLPLGRVPGVVTEDRGPFGPSGQHVYKVSVPNDPYATDEFLLREKELSRLNPEEEKQFHAQLDPDAIRDFLASGGLVAILQRESHRPIWIRRDAKGNLTFTFIEGYSSTGGFSAPRDALVGEKVRITREPDVLDFIMRLGLSNQAAEYVVEKVGKSAP